MFQTKVVEKIKTRIVCSGTFFFENRAVYEITRKTIVEGGRPEMILIGRWYKVVKTVHDNLTGKSATTFSK
jgi:hypothetical protein